MKRCCASILVLSLICGCGYTTIARTPPNVHTIYVPVFDNRTFRRGSEFDLTRAIKTEILHKSDLRIASRHRADSELIGEIVEIDESVLLEDLNDDIVASGVTVTVNIVWRDLRTGRTLLDIKGVSDGAQFIVLRGENVGSATEEAFRDLAEQIVRLLEKDW